MGKIERRVYNNWAFTDQEKLKGKINSQIYEALKRKYRCVVVFRTEVGLYNKDTFDLIIIREVQFRHSNYYIHHNTTPLSDDEILLICDQGNLCFGGQRIGDVYVVEED